MNLYSSSQTFIELVYRDQIEGEFEFESQKALKTIHTYGAPYWITVTPFLDSPLPEWALAAIFARAPLRFPRFLFGHENWQQRRSAVDPSYRDIRVRAQLEIHQAGPEKINLIAQELESQNFFLPPPLRIVLER